MAQFNRAQIIFFIIFLTFILPGPANNEQEYLGSGKRKHALKELTKELLYSRTQLADHDYEYGYGNITGFKLSYDDVLLGRNVSDWPFEDRLDTDFKEDQTRSILPNVVSQLAAKIWNTEEQIITLPSSNIIGKISTGYDDSVLEEQIKVREANKKLLNLFEVGDSEKSKKINSGGYWFNITGTLRGSFNLSTQTFEKIQMPLPDYFEGLLDEINNGNNNNNNNNNGDSDDNEDNTLNLRKNADDHSLDYNDATADSSSFDSTLDTLDVPNGDFKLGNITDLFGNTKFVIENFNKTENGSDTSTVSLRLVLSDEGETREHNIHMNGVYHQKSGNLVAASRSAKFQSVYSLPFLNLNNLKLYNQTKNIVIDSWRGKTLEEFDPQLLEVFAENSRSCEMITYLHFESTDLSESELKDIDDELINPLGRPYRRPPQVVITNGLVYSPDCGILVKINEARGPRAEIQDNYIKNLLLLFLFILLAQILLFIRQMGSTNTPSTMSRISFWTLAIMNLVDGSISMITLLCASIFTSLYIQFAVCAFLAFTCSTIFEMRYMIMIYATQMNERNISFRVSLQGTPIDEREAQREEQQQQEQQTPTTNTDTLLPVNNTPNNAQPQAATTTATTPNNTITTPQDEQTIGGQMYSRTFIALIVFSFFILNTILLPKKQRIFFEYLFGILVNSYWIPQIYRNVIRGSRRSFAWEFIVGTSIIRLLPICYLCIYKGNPLYHHQDIQLVSLLISWVSLQIFVLFLQEIFGARFFLPEKYLPQSYDYHPVLSFKDLENGFGIEQVNVETNENGGISKCKVDCAICMTEFDIPVSSSSINDSENSENSSSLPHSHIGVSPFNIMARRTYMVTPCRHIFHTNCLESWMKYKLQCPVCRNSLPPL